MIIGICDDDREYMATIKSKIETCIQTYNVDYKIYSYETFHDLLEAFGKIDFDCLFLDIYIGRENGMDLAKMLRQNNYDNSIIFTTTSKEHVFDSFLVNPMDYLLKPIDENRLKLVIEKLCNLYTPRFLTIKTNLGDVDIPIQDIYYIETVGNHQQALHKKNLTIKTSTPMNEIEKNIDQYQCFLRCHRSYIINLDYVASINELDVTLLNGEKALLSVRNASRLRKTILQYIMHKN